MQPDQSRSIHSVFSFSCFSASRFSRSRRSRSWPRTKAIQAMLPPVSTNSKTPIAKTSAIFIRLQDPCTSETAIFSEENDTGVVAWDGLKLTDSDLLAIGQPVLPADLIGFYTLQQGCLQDHAKKSIFDENPRVSSQATVP